ncbi:MAG: glutathione S-transferase family protein [Myxococcota bacterium]
MNNEAALTLHRHPLSGHCHRVELLLALAGLSCELINVDLAARAQKQPAFLQKNRFGQVPVLTHGDFTLADSTAILVYLAERFPSASAYLPRDPQTRGQIQRWLAVAAGQLVQGPANARAVRVFKRDLDHAHAVNVASALFTVMDAELSEHPFLIGATPTLADIALYAYTAHAPEGDISLEPYPNIRAWLTRIEALPRFVPMQRAKQS